MSDKLLLTILGAVGIGALMMGMNTNDNVQEDFIGGNMVLKKVTVKCDKDDNCTEVDPDDSKGGAVLNQGKNIKMAERRKRMDQRADEQQKENFEYFQSSLGSGEVANPNIFYSNPKFDQSTPLRSPDMQNLAVSSRMRESSMQGHTDSFNPPIQNGSMIGSVENFEENAVNEENVIYQQRLMVSTKGGGRFNARGSVDFIRGDIPVCPDPCQSGWFRSSAKPEDVLQVGAVYKMIAGDSTAKELNTLITKNGGINQQSQLTSNMQPAVSRAGGTVSTPQ
jgi:hypothetical protein